MSRIIRIRNTEDAVAEIAALTTRVIAAAGHPGHGLESVGQIITSDTVLETIRTAYNRRITQGATPKDAVIAVGQSLIAHYCNSAGI
ncbi:hypothetical protein [Streptomyces sp. SPB4]|uniref:hypothetical protein n=1 Tax=Streptomyces sp. SPB4 TaxID=2940553 RepID=UPI00247321BF|nr:hypothetical protein [Streptomyces sp. SPB4]MDH6544140.1 hypothetical protein [Streptomyces sp. SPB4]